MVHQRAEEFGFKFNRNKCKFMQNEIKFFSHIFSEDEVKPENNRIKAILNMPISTNGTELQRFFGVINY